MILLFTCLYKSQATFLFFGTFLINECCPYCNSLNKTITLIVWCILSFRTWHHDLDRWDLTFRLLLIALSQQVLWVLYSTPDSKRTQWWAPDQELTWYFGALQETKRAWQEFVFVSGASLFCFIVWWFGDLFK